MGAEMLFSALADACKVVRSIVSQGITRQNRPADLVLFKTGDHLDEFHEYDPVRGWVIHGAFATLKDETQVWQ